MDASNDSESGQEKHKSKNPIVENDLVGENDCLIWSSDDDGEDVDRRGLVAENLCKKRKKRKREICTLGGQKALPEDGVLEHDPLVFFGSDIMLMILRHLDARSLALSLLVSRGWFEVASSDRLWTTKCEELWLGKAHIPSSAQVHGLSKLAAYSRSAIDGQWTRILKEELCEHVWEFHFNETAPDYWRNLDGPPMRCYFHPDWSLTADSDDMVWGGHKSCYSIVSSLFGDGRIRDHYVRINRWPKLSILRKEDWSWEMSNNLFCFTSIPDVDKSCVQG